MPAATGVVYRTFDTNFISLRENGGIREPTLNMIFRFFSGKILLLLFRCRESRRRSRRLINAARYRSGESDAGRKKVIEKSGRRRRQDRSR